MDGELIERHDAERPDFILRIKPRSKHDIGTIVGIEHFVVDHYSFRNKQGVLESANKKDLGLYRGITKKYGNLGNALEQQIDNAVTDFTDVKTLFPLDDKILDVKFLKYALEIVTFEQQKSSVPNINSNMMKAIRIPLPPMKVQEEIVRILDKFTELTAELTARKKQYEFYRDKLLCSNFKFDKNVSL